MIQNRSICPSVANNSAIPGTPYLILGMFAFSAGLLPSQHAPEGLLGPIGEILVARGRPVRSCSRKGCSSCSQKNVCCRRFPAG